MIVKAYLTTFGEGAVRDVEVADGLSGKPLLDAAFEFGQNERQPRRQPSVSVGDVIETPDGLWRVMVAGFKRLEDGADPVALLGDDANRAGMNLPPRGIR